MELSTTLIIVGVIILLIVGIILFVVLSPDEPQPPVPPIIQKGWATKQSTLLGSESDTTGITVSSVSTFSNTNAYTFGADFFPGPTVSKIYDIFNGSQNNTPEQRLELSSDADGFISSLVKYDTDGQVIWAAKITGTWNIAGGTFPQNNNGQFITVDKNENIYIMGAFGANEAGTTVTFYDAITDSSQDPSPRWTMSRLADNFYNVFLAKYDKNGILQWTTKVGSATNGRSVSGFSIDCNDTHVFISGAYRGDANFYDGTQGNPSTERWTLTKSESNTTADAFVAKYDFEGVLQWTTKIDGSGSEILSMLAVNNDNVCVFGSYGSVSINLYNAIAADPITPVGSLSKTGGTNALFLANFDTAGQLQWTTKVQNNAIFNNSGITFDSSGNIIISALTSGNSVVFYDVGTGPSSWDPSTTKWTVTSVNVITGYTLGLLAKYDSTGVLQWTSKTDFVENNAYYRGVTTDSEGNIYGLVNFDKATLYDGDDADPTVTRWTLTNESGLGGIPNASIVKYTPSGEVVWSTLLGSVLNAELLGITSDINDNIYATGYYYESVNIYEVQENGEPAVDPIIAYANEGGYRQGVVIKYTKDAKIIV